tara:strand:- start:30 stop:320 length:291 start_codon:yes stop_codon:yes gene_type:complete
MSWGDYPEDAPKLKTRRDLEDLERYHHNSVDHPDHYGGKDNTYEAIKIIEAYDLNFSLGNAIKYIIRAGKKNSNTIEDLEKAKWYVQRQIEFLEAK